MRGRYPTVEVEDGIVWSATTGPWLCVRLAGLHYDGLTVAERIERMQSFEDALATIEAGEAMMLTVEVPARHVVQATDDRVHLAEYNRQVNEWVAAQQYTARTTFLAVRLNRIGVSTLAAVIGQALRLFSATRDTGRAARDRNSYRVQANALVHKLNAAGLPVLPATREELARLVSRPCWLDMDRAATQPRGVIEPRRWHHTHVVQRDDERYVTTLVAEDFNLPAFPTAPSWLLPMPHLDFRPDVVVRFDMVTANDEAAVLDRAHAAHTDQVENITRDGDTDDPKVSIALAEKLATTRELAHAVREAQQPWVWPQVCVTVAAPTVEVLEERVRATTSAFVKRGVKLLAPPADQYQLLMEQIPGSRWRTRDWTRRWPIRTLAVGMPHATTILGMDEGPYLGHTSSLDRTPVYMDLSALPRLGISPTVAFTGQPGSGKSATAKKVAIVEPRLRGAWVLVLDPANETDPVLALPGLGRTQVYQLDTRFAGLLDAWVMYADKPKEAAALAVDLVMIMLPNVQGTTTEIGLTALADKVSRSERPSMRAFVDAMRASNDPALVAVGTALATYAELDLASLFFGEYTGAQLDISDSLTVLRWSGLDLPEPGTEDKDLTSRNRMSAAVLHGTATLVRKLMEHTDRDTEKVLVMDEAHQFTTSPAGRALVRRYSAMSRKHGLTVVLISQNAAHLHGGDEALLNNVSVVFAFRSTDVGEQQAVGRLLRRGYVDREGHWHSDPEIMARVGRLGTRPDSTEVQAGFCLLRDPYNRVGEVQIDHPVQQLWQAVQTTPQGAPRRPTEPVSA